MTHAASSASADTTPLPPGGEAGPRMRSRRELLRPAKALAALWAGGAASSAARAATTNEVTADVDPGAVLPKLVRRMCLGPTTADYAQAESLGWDGFVEYHLDHLSIDDSALDAQLAGNPTVTGEPWQLFGIDAGLLTRLMMDSAIIRAIGTRRQFFERVVEFWRDHFNISVHKYPGMHLLPRDDRLIIRGLAFDSFVNMVLFSSTSPAMLNYLDNQLSVAGAPNENYARELMELHTLGVDNGYTQHDVVDLARCLTGWGFSPPFTTPGTGLFRYTASQHDNGPKTVVGLSIPPNGGQTDGYNAVLHLSLHPNTAGFIARKMVTRFFGEGAPQGLVEAVKQTYLETSGDIREMLRVILRPNVMHDAPPKFKRPLHLIASALRVLPHTLTDPAGLRAILSAAGHLPYSWAPPNGYPDTTAHWSGLLVPRWNFAFKLAEGSIAGLSVDFAGFLAGRSTADEVMDHVDAELFGGAMPADEKQAIRAFLASDPSSAQRRAEAVALSICTPAFQWY